MIDDIKVTLQGAKGVIHVTIGIGPAWVLVTYRGYPSDMLAIDAIEPVMVEKGRKGYRQYDSQGDRYRQQMFKSGKLEVCRMVTTFARARKLPGVPPDISDPMIDWLDQNPGKMHTKRQPTVCGTSVWIQRCGTRQALDAAGVQGDAFPILDGYYSIATWETIPDAQQPTAEWPFSFSRESYDVLNMYDKAVIRSEFKRLVDRAKQNNLRRSRPAFLRLVVSNHCPE